MIRCHKESETLSSMLCFSPPMEHTLLSQAVKDREGRGNWQHAVQWLAAKQYGRGEERSTSQRRLCGRGQQQSLWDKRRFMCQCTGIHLHEYVSVAQINLLVHLLLNNNGTEYFLTTNYLQDQHLNTFPARFFCFPRTYCIRVLLTACSKRRACISACVFSSSLYMSMLWYSAHTHQESVSSAIL